LHIVEGESQFGHVLLFSVLPKNKKLIFRWQTARRICAICNGVGWPPTVQLEAGMYLHPLFWIDKLLFYNKPTKFSWLAVKRRQLLLPEALISPKNYTRNRLAAKLRPNPVGSSQRFPDIFLRTGYKKRLGKKKSRKGLGWKD